MLIHNVNIIVGDRWDDGHGKTETFAIKSNYPAKQIHKAFKTVATAMAANYQNYFEFCSSYQDNMLSKHDQLELKESGIDLHVVLQDQEVCHENIYEEALYLNTESYMALWCAVVKLEIKDFEFEIVAEDNAIEIGGYGLFN